MSYLESEVVHFVLEEFAFMETSIVVFAREPWKRVDSLNLAFASSAVALVTDCSLHRLSRDHSVALTSVGIIRSLPSGTIMVFI